MRKVLFISLSAVMLLSSGIAYTLLAGSTDCPASKECPMDNSPECQKAKANCCK